MREGRKVWVKIRASRTERAEWHAKAAGAGLALSDLVRQSLGKVRTWTVVHAERERKRIREMARIGSNLNQIARWANIYQENTELALAHVLRNRIEALYRWTDLFERRRQLIEDWAAYFSGEGGQ